jgi:hypothetical protein
MTQLIPTIALLGITAVANAGPSTPAATLTVPNCWRANNPGLDIQDGAYVIKYATNGHTATEFGQLLGHLNGINMKQQGVGSMLDGATIEIDLQAPLAKDWRASGAYPTFAAVQRNAMSSLNPLLKLDGVQVECVKVMHVQPR